MIKNIGLFNDSRSNSKYKLAFSIKREKLVVVVFSTKIAIINHSYVEDLWIDVSDL